ncbi:MAG: hypothetical protein RJA76_522 [Bacteroidota bacterium]|jgi:hypothetical protein
MIVMPRHIALEFIYKNNKQITGPKIGMLFRLFNCSVGIFREILNDLEKGKLIDLKGYSRNNSNNKLTYLPENFNQLQIKLTLEGVEYVEIKLLGIRKPFKTESSPSDYIQLSNVGIQIESVNQQFGTFEEFAAKFKGSLKMDLPVAYYLLTGKKNPNGKKTIFISYSWDPIGMKKWALSLANKLLDKYDVIIDQKSFIPGDNIEQRMIESIVNADHVLVLLTPEYKIKADEKRGGVGFEASIIDNELDKYVVGRKYIPVIRTGDRHTSVPAFMGNILPIDGRIGKFRMKLLLEALEK